jgi:TPR repeat protein
MRADLAVSAPPQLKRKYTNSASPFPRLQQRPSYVPPSAEEMESLLESARITVLRSNDPELQLVWAQDALAWVEIASTHEIRIADGQTPRAKTPPIEHQLRIDATSIVAFLADQYHPTADFIRGTWFEFGKFGMPVDRREAFRAYARSASRGYARSQYRMGVQFENSTEFQKAIKHYNLGAAANDSASNYRLGMMIILGHHGHQQDLQRGVQLVKLAAQSADLNAPQAAYVYGMMIARELNGVSIPESLLPNDVKASRQNIEKAAFLGFSKAQVRMGQAYDYGQLGCRYNPELSLHYYVLASRQAEPEAEMAINKWFLSGCEGLFEKNEELAFVYAKRAAKECYPNAEFAMGYMLEIGLGTPQDISEAQRWYALAAEHGHVDAATRVEGLKRSNTLTRKDHEKVALERIKSQRGDRVSETQKPPPVSPRSDAPVSSYQRASSRERYQDTGNGRLSGEMNRTDGRRPSGEQTRTDNRRPSTELSRNDTSQTSTPYSFLNPNLRPVASAQTSSQQNRLENNPGQFNSENRRNSASYDYNRRTSSERPSMDRQYGSSPDTRNEFSQRPVSGFNQNSQANQALPGPGSRPTQPQPTRVSTSSSFSQADSRESLPSRRPVPPPVQEDPRKYKLQNPFTQRTDHAAGTYGNNSPPEPRRESSNNRVYPPLNNKYSETGGPQVPAKQSSQYTAMPPTKQSQYGAPASLHPKPQQSFGAPTPLPTPPAVPQGPPLRPGGPQTFEEMGVPKVKKEDDCVGLLQSYEITNYLGCHVKRLDELCGLFARLDWI